MKEKENIIYEPVKSKFDEFQEEFIAQWMEYKRWNDELDVYRGKGIGEDVERVNTIIYNIQRTFGLMFPALTFINKYQSDCIQMVHSYNSFVESMRKAGAIAVKGETL
jgi:hypothetical protein